MILPFHSCSYLSARRVVALLWLLLAGFAARAQAPAWETALPLPVNVSASVYDAAGNVYLAGRFSGTKAFGSTTLSTTFSHGDMYVAKWNLASGRFLWAVQAGGTQDNGAVVTTLAVSGTSVYVGGTFLDHTAAFGATTLSNNGVAARSDDGFTLFVTKVTDAGTSASFTWAKAAGSTYLGELNGLAVIGKNVYITGYFNGNRAKFDAITLISGPNPLNPTRPSDNWGYADVYVARLTDAGTTASFTWAIRAGSAGDDSGEALTTDGTSLYLAGYFTSTPTGFGTAALQSVDHTRDAFVAKLIDTGTTGSFLWAQQGGGSDTDGVDAIAVSGSSVYVGGSFRSPTASFGATTLNLLTSPIYSSPDIFVAKLIDAGTSASYAWALRAGGAESESITSLLPQGSSLYLTGLFSSKTWELDGTTLTNTNTAGNQQSAYLTKLTDTGTAQRFVWAKGLTNAFAVGISQLHQVGTRLYATTSIRATTSFDNLTATVPVVGSGYALLATLQDNVSLAAGAPTAAAESSLYPNPASTSTTVRVPAVAGASYTTLTLRDALGRVVRTTTLPLPATGLTHELALTGLPSGVYLLHVQVGTTTAVHRLAVGGSRE